MLAQIMARRLREEGGSLHRMGARVTMVGVLAVALLAPHGALAATAQNDRFLQVRAPHLVRHGVPWVVIHTKTRPGRIDVRLNGRDVTENFVRPDGKPRKATLSPTEGLRRGRNRLVVVAVAKGKRHTERRTIIEHSHLMPAAGHDREIWPGQRVRLDGSGSIAAAGARRLHYRWQIVGKPKGSRARLKGAGTADPKLLTDQRGIYRIHLSLRGRGGRRGARSSAAAEPTPPLTSSADEVQVEATKTEPIGLPVRTYAIAGGPPGYGIRIGEELFKNEDLSGESVQILQLSQTTLEKKENKAVKIGTSAKDMEGDICGPSGVVILSVPPKLSQKFAELYAGHIGCMPKPLRTPTPNGAATISAGGQITNWNGPMGGYLQKAVVPTAKEKLSEASEFFRYVAGDYLTFEAQPLAAPANGNTIVLGGPGQPVDASFKGELPAATAGFQALSINAETAAPLESKAFATNGGSTESQLKGITELASWLEARKVEPGTRVFLQSIGHPQSESNPNPTEWARVARLVGEMGGNSHIFNRINGAYAFYGGAGMGPGAISQGFDTSTAETNLPARLHGVLSRDPLYEYAPRVTAATEAAGSTDLELMSIVYQEPEEWPVPKGPEQTAAVEWLITERITPHYKNITSLQQLRSEYWESNAISREPSLVIGHLDCGEAPQEKSFDPAEFKVVCEEIEDELEWTGAVAKFLGGPGEIVTGDLQQALISPTSLQIVETIKSEMAKQLAPYDPGSDKTAADVLTWASDLTWVGAEVTDADGVNPVGLFAAVSGLATDFASLRNGESPATIQEKADEVASQFLVDTATTLRQLPHLYEIIASDYGKLSTVAERLGPGGEWKWTKEDANEDSNAFIAASIRWAYRQLLPVRYSTQILVPHAALEDEENMPPGEYVCESYASERIEYIHAFHDPPEGSYFDHYSTPSQPNAYWIMTDSSGSPPSSELTKALQESPTNLYLPWLMEELEVENYPSKCK
jgi:hypothetical protein